MFVRLTTSKSTTEYGFVHNPELNNVVATCRLQAYLFLVQQSNKAPFRIICWGPNNEKRLLNHCFPVVLLFSLWIFLFDNLWLKPKHWIFFIWVQDQKNPSSVKRKVWSKCRFLLSVKWPKSGADPRTVCLQCLKSY